MPERASREHNRRAFFFDLAVPATVSGKWERIVKRLFRFTATGQMPGKARSPALSRKPGDRSARVAHASDQGSPMRGDP